METQFSSLLPIDRRTQQLVARRARLCTLLGDLPLVVHAGILVPRNYKANAYPFRASSHFLYLCGLSTIPGAVLVLAQGKSSLFLEPVTPEDELWDGPQPSWETIQAQTGVDHIFPLVNLTTHLQQLEQASGPCASLPLPPWPSPESERATEAILSIRLQHDELAIHELRRASAITHAAHVAGMRATRPGVRESHVRAAMEQPIQAADFCTAYNSIVTVHGEVLHTHNYSGLCQDGDLLLADVGAETDTGWASDVTRTWPVNGRFSPSQRAIYEIVLAAQKQAISLIKPGVRYRALHDAACLVIAEGLCDLKILLGRPSDLVERGAHALFFPHGVGHLLGLDVHDMEDLGENRVGYAPGRTRSTLFGTKYLRLDRDLAPGMAFTIEPGIYFIPALWKHEPTVAPFKRDVAWDRLAAFQDVRGIRIEDNVLLTSAGPEVLTRSIPKEIEQIEQIVGR